MGGDGVPRTTALRCKVATTESCLAVSVMQEPADIWEYQVRVDREGSMAEARGRSDVAVGRKREAESARGRYKEVKLARSRFEEEEHTPLAGRQRWRWFSGLGRVWTMQSVSLRSPQASQHYPASSTQPMSSCTLLSPALHLTAQ